MKGILITNKGLEDVSKKEVKDILNTGAVKKHCLVEFEVKNYSDLCKLVYRSQSARRVILLLKKFKINSLDDLEKIKTKELDKWLSGNSFKALCERQGKHNFNSMDVTRKICQLLDYDVDFKNPCVSLYTFIDQSSLYFGIDFCGFDLGKRDYNVFIHKESVKANIAYATATLAEAKSSETIVDPFCKSGLVIIETAKKLLNKPIHEHKKKEFAFNKLKLDFDLQKFFKSEDSIQERKKLALRGFDKINNIISARKNARIAEVDEFVSFETCELNELNTQFKDKNVDKIITKMPVFKNTMNKITERTYKEFFNQADLILKENGKIVILSDLKELVGLRKSKFVVKKKFEPMSGKAELNIYVITR